MTPARKSTRRIAAVHDLSGVGRVSLMVVIPILSTMGFDVCPLPTAILSNHTQYPEYSFLDLTDEMPKMIAGWKKLEIEFDAIYTLKTVESTLSQIRRRRARGTSGLWPSSP